LQNDEQPLGSWFGDDKDRPFELDLRERLFHGVGQGRIWRANEPGSGPLSSVLDAKRLLISGLEDLRYCARQRYD